MSTDRHPAPPAPPAADAPACTCVSDPNGLNIRCPVHVRAKPADEAAGAGEPDFMWDKDQPGFPQPVPAPRRERWERAVWVLRRYCESGWKADEDVIAVDRDEIEAVLNAYDHAVAAPAPAALGEVEALRRWADEQEERVDREGHAVLYEIIDKWEALATSLAERLAAARQGEDSDG